MQCDVALHLLPRSATLQCNVALHNTHQSTEIYCRTALLILLLYFALHSCAELCCTVLYCPDHCWGRVKYNAVISAPTSDLPVLLPPSTLPITSNPFHPCLHSPIVSMSFEDVSDHFPIGIHFNFKSFNFWTEHAPALTGHSLHSKVFEKDFFPILKLGPISPRIVW